MVFGAVFSLGEGCEGSSPIAERDLAVCDVVPAENKPTPCKDTERALSMKRVEMLRSTFPFSLRSQPVLLITCSVL